MIGNAARPARVSPVAAALVVTAATAVGITAGVVVQRLGSQQASPALPELHGQAAWAAGTRPAPPFALPDQTGRVVSPSSLRGRPVLLTFLGATCASRCAAEGRQIAWILGGLPAAERPELVVVTLDRRGDSAALIRQAMRSWHLLGSWTWHWLSGTPGRLADVRRSYGAVAEPRARGIAQGRGLVLIDRRGYERTAYLLPFQPPFLQGDLATLAREAA